MIDIVMASYNGAKYIGEQLDSIINQTYKDIRIIIRDDGSKDETIQIIRDYEKRYPGKVLLVADEVKCGSAKSNFMQAMSYSDADYVMFSDQDDYWLPEKVQHTFDKMIEVERRIGREKPVLVFGSYKAVDENLRDISYNEKGRQEAAYKLAFSNLLVQNYVNGCLMMVNRTLASIMGKHDDRILMHDWWAAIIAAGGGYVEHIDEVMMLYRQHGDNVVGSVDVKSFRYRIKKFINPETKKAALAYREQAILLKERAFDCLDEIHRKELNRFIELYEKNKIGRMRDLVKGRYLKSDFVRVIGQLWYI